MQALQCLLNAKVNLSLTGDPIRTVDGLFFGCFIDRLIMVGDSRFELLTSASRTLRATKLRQSP